MIIVSCNQQDSTQETADSTQINTLADGDSLLNQPQRKFYNLELQVEQLKKLLNTGAAGDEGRTVKIIFQFTSPNLQTDNALALVGYGAQSNGDTTSDAVELTRSAATQVITGTANIGNLELTRKKLKAILGITGSGPIPENRLVPLYFWPVKGDNNYITYWITTTAALTPTAKTNFADAEDNELNPSPPDPPCVNCDN